MGINLMVMSLATYIKRGLRYIACGVPNVQVGASISYLLPSNKLSGKNIIVTGGGRGLGKAMAEKFVAEGANVLISGRREENLKSVSETIGCKYLVFDVCDASSAGTFMDRAGEILGGVDVLVNNAGISLHEWAIENVSVEQFDRQVETNLRGGYFLSQKFIETFRRDKRKNGCILFISSERGEQTDDIPYGLTKAAINSFVRGIAPKLIKDGIRINALAPGITTSDMTGFKEDGNLYCAGNPNNRVYLPEEVAEVASFLVSDTSSCISGQVIACNEGKTGNSRHIYK